MEIAHTQAAPEKPAPADDSTAFALSSRMPPTGAGLADPPRTTRPQHDAAGLRTPSTGGATDEAREGSGKATDRSELRGAISMVSLGFATRVVVCGLLDPEAALTSLITEAADAGTSLHLDRRECGMAVEVRRL